MMSSETLRGGNPADALAVVIRRLGRPVDLDVLAARFEVHEQPSSLLALVQIAPEWGLAARAFQGELENLASLELPAVVHLRSELDGEGGFAVLVRQGGGSFELTDPSGATTRTLGAEAFASVWSGIVVTFTSGTEPAVPPREPGAFERFVALARSDRQAAALVAARSGALVAVPLLAALSALRLRPPGIGVAAAALVAVDLLAAFVCVTLLHASRRTRVASATPRLAQKICGRGKLGDCEGVLGSKWARIGGFDLPVLGLGFAASHLALAAASIVASPETARAIFAWIAALHVVALPASLFFVGIQIWPLRRVCPLCMTMHLCVGVGAALALPLLGSAPTPSAAVAAAVIAAHALAFLGTVGGVVPLLELSLESRASRARLGWIGATVWGALAEAAGRTPAFSDPPAAAFSLGDATAPFRLDVLVHPFCTGCGPVVDGLEALVRRHGRDLQVAFHLAPRDPKDPGDLALCTAISAIGLLAGGEQTLHVFRAVKAEPRKYLEAARADGAGRVAASLLGSGAPVDGVLPAAAAAVERADRLASSLRTGTPTVLVNGRVWESTLDELDGLLARYPAIAAEALGARRTA